MDVVRILPHARPALIVVAKTVLTLLLLAALGFYIHKYWDSGYFRYKIRQLNRIMPVSFSNLVKIEQINAADVKDVVPYNYFYEEVTQYFPEQADAWGMLGFCQYYFGKKDEARKSFEEAIERQGDFFWFYYNLAIVDYESGRYDQAITSLRKALSADRLKTIQYIWGSNVIYRTIMMDARISLSDIQRRLDGGYDNAELLLKIAEEHLTGARKQPIKIAVRIF